MELEKPCYLLGTQKKVQGQTSWAWDKGLHMLWRNTTVRMGMIVHVSAVPARATHAEYRGGGSHGEE